MLVYSPWHALLCSPLVVTRGRQRTAITRALAAQRADGETTTLETRAIAYGHAQLGSSAPRTSRSSTGAVDREALEATRDRPADADGTKLNACAKSGRAGPVDARFCEALGSARSLALLLSGEIRPTRRLRAMARLAAKGFANGLHRRRSRASDTGSRCECVPCVQCSAVHRCRRDAGLSTRAASRDPSARLFPELQRGARQ